MRARWILRGLKFVLFIVLAALVLGYVVMHLWNWLLPAVFGWHMINYSASPGNFGFDAPAIRRFSRPSRSWHVLAPPHDGALGEDDPRRTRKVSPRNERTLRSFSWAPSASQPKTVA